LRTAKKEIRKALVNKRKKLSEDTRQLWSRKITDLFINKLYSPQVNKIMAYLPIKGEVDTYPLIKWGIEKGISIFVPRTDPKSKTMKPIKITDLNNDLIVGAYGIYEPKDDLKETIAKTEIDIIIVPGVAFDESGYRLGYGGGYYDKFLDKASLDTINAAFSYEFQVVSELPREAWDKRVDAIITEEKVRFV